MILLREGSLSYKTQKLAQVVQNLFNHVHLTLCFLFPKAHLEFKKTVEFLVVQELCSL